MESHGLCLLLLGLLAAPAVIANEDEGVTHQSSSNPLGLRGSVAVEGKEDNPAAVLAFTPAEALETNTISETNSSSHEHQKHPKPETKHKHHKKKDDGVPKSLAPYVIALIVYGILYSLVRIEFPEHTAEYEKAHRILCCWREIYVGQSCLIYDVLFCPVVMTWHALRIYLFWCLGTYSTRIYWLAFGRFTHYFQDDQFPPEPKSLGNVKGDATRSDGSSTAEVVWVRAMDLRRSDIHEKAEHPTLHDTKMRLFRKKILPADILQGALGDCWLLAAMAALAERPGVLQSLFITDEISPEGKYKLRLFNPGKNAWENIIIDDYVPCARSPKAYSKDNVARDKDEHIITMYASPRATEMWTLILEKAFAKMCGSYGALDGGCTEWAMRCMTGEDAWAYWRMEDDKWQRFNLVQKEDGESIRDVGWLETDYHHDSDDLFKRLRFYCRNGALIACSGVDAEGEKMGLVAGHAFTVLKVCVAQKSVISDDFFRMVQIRNPWGKRDASGAGEWKGTWCDGDQAWDTYPHVKSKLYKEQSNRHDEDDGIFWMQWNDFIKYWNTVSIVDVDMNILTLMPPIHDEENWYGPCKVCSLGCFEYWSPPWCFGLRRLYFGHHEAKSSELHTDDYGRKCGIDGSGCYCRFWEQNAIMLEK